MSRIENLKQQREILQNMLKRSNNPRQSQEIRSKINSVNGQINKISRVGWC